MSTLNMSLADLLARIGGSTDKANKANEERYGEIKGLYESGRNVANNQLNATGQFLKDRIGSISGLLIDSGRGAKRDARRDSAERVASGMGDLSNRGFGTSATLGAALKRREGEALDRSLNDIDERVSNQRAGFETQTTGDLGNFMLQRTGLQQDLVERQAGFMERRSDLPGNSDLTALMQLLGQGGGLGGGGGFRGGGSYGLSIGQNIGGRRIA